MPNESPRNRGEAGPSPPGREGERQRPKKSGKQGPGPEWTGEGDSSTERAQRAGQTGKGGGSEWQEK